MIDLPDYGYKTATIHILNEAGISVGPFNGPAQHINRPGVRYAVTYTLRGLRSADEARVFQMLLEQAVASFGGGEDVSYPWPLDFSVGPGSVGTPKVNGASGAGATIPIKNALPNYQFKQGQPVSVLSGGIGFIHKVTEPTRVAADGTAVLPVFPITRAGFLNNDPIEVKRPRIMGMLTWDGTTQPAYGSRPFSFTISERV